MKILTLPTKIDGEFGAHLTAVDETGSAIGGCTVTFGRSAISSLYVAPEFTFGRSALISSLYVAPEFRLENVASRLIDHCCAEANQRLCEGVATIVKSENKEARLLYHKKGLRVVYDFEDGDLLMGVILNP